MLVPMIGIAHVGRQALADRYSYLPMIGLAVALVWGVAELFARVRAPALRRLFCAAAACVLVGYGVAAFGQTRTWRDSETLYRHTLAVSPRASAIHRNLAGWLRTHRFFEDAAVHYRAALEVDPGNAQLHFDLGRTLHAQGQTAAAIEEYLAAAALDPSDAVTPYQLGLSYEMEGRFVEASKQYRRAVELDPANPKPRQRLAAVMARQGGR
jgi:Flp pilus assembly protein TadD